MGRPLRAGEAALVCNGRTWTGSPLGSSSEGVSDSRTQVTSSGPSWPDGPLEGSPVHRTVASFVHETRAMAITVAVDDDLGSLSTWARNGSVRTALGRAYVSWRRSGHEPS
jgi:hypothetical protein